MKSVVLRRNAAGAIVVYHDDSGTVVVTYPDGQGRPKHQPIMPRIETELVDFEVQRDTVLQIEAPRRKVRSKRNGF